MSVTRHPGARAFGALCLLFAACVPPAPPVAPGPGPAPTRSPAADRCLPEPVVASLFTCPARRPDDGEPMIWPRPSHVVDPRPLPVEQPVTTAAIAALVRRDELLPRLDPAAQKPLLAADAALAAAASDDSKLAPARTAYEAFLATPPTAGGAGALEPYARFQLARTLWLLGEPAAAQAELLRVIGLGGELGEPARRELVALYARHGDPASAYDVLRALAPAGGAGDGRALELVEAVAREAERTGQLATAAALYEELERRAGASPRACAYGLGRARAVVGMKSYPPPVLEALKHEVERLQRLAAAGQDGAAGAEVARCRAAALSLGTEVATRWHVEAVGARGVWGTRDNRTFGAARELYRLLLGAFGDADLASPEVDLLPAARPSAHRLKWALAELDTAERRGECAPAYDELHALEPDAAEPVYRAVACYAERPDFGLAAGRLEPGPREELRPELAARVAILGRYLCLGEPPRSFAEAYASYVAAKLDRARIFAAAHEWPEAAAALRDVAVHHPDHEDAPRAGLFYLEILKLLGPERSACASDLAAEAKLLHDLHCGAQGVGHGDFEPFRRSSDASERRTLCAALRVHAAGLVPPPLDPPLAALPRPSEPEDPPLSIRMGGGASREHILPIELVEQRARARLGAMRGCYELGLRRNPTLEGRIELRFVIGRDGSVSQVDGRSSAELEAAKVTACVVRSAYGMSFPPPGDHILTIDYRLGFTRALGLIPPQPEDAARVVRDPGEGPGP
ncbi:MAG: AgmX/PglI C-terminal domain-containing protein [Polyangiaceae bacterium]|nr:AgmX/PglI C-terminal domain-containing protein [Polyangiaceae bacterium]